MTSLSPKRIISKRILSPIREFIRDSRSVGIILILCTVLSLLLSNSGWGESYRGFWEKEFHTGQTGIHLPHTILHLINDGLMALFFFLVGLEIKRELMIGELASLKKSLLPVMAALGGMVVPAGIFLLWCGDTPYSKGWGIPMATDIAFSLGILSLLGRKAPLSLRIFLTALAIIDDLGGILAIAIFYAQEIRIDYLLGSGGLVLLLALMNFYKVRYYSLYFIIGLLLWYLVYNSGVHATIAGVALALTIPLHKIDKLEHALHDPVNFLIMPLFALANTAILLPDSFASIFTSPVHHGILTGLAIGKPAGIFLFSYLAVKSGIGMLPEGINWKQVLGMGMIAGIGFTISIFMSTLAFQDPAIQTVAKVAIMGASLLAAVGGFLYLNLLDLRKVREQAG